ncbi:Oxoglutarate/iron-dependent dioxygenase, partial [Parasponia andersonii]
EFIKLPLEKKIAHAQQPNRIEGYSQSLIVSEEQKLYVIPSQSPHLLETYEVPASLRIPMSLLLQANDVQGLQIKKNDKWVLVKPISGAFVININNIIELK